MFRTALDEFVPVSSLAVNALPPRLSVIDARYSPRRIDWRRILSIQIRYLAQSFCLISSPNPLLGQGQQPPLMVAVANPKAHLHTLYLCEKKKNRLLRQEVYSIRHSLYASFYLLHRNASISTSS